MEDEDAKTLAWLTEILNSGEARDIRQDALWTLDGVAQALGVSASTVHKWEARKTRPSARVALAYGRLLVDLAGFQPAGTPVVNKASVVGFPDPQKVRVPPVGWFETYAELERRPQL